MPAANGIDLCRELDAVVAPHSREAWAAAAAAAGNEGRRERIMARAEANAASAERNGLIASTGGKMSGAKMGF